MGFLKQAFNNQFDNPMDRIGYGLNLIAMGGGADPGYRFRSGSELSYMPPFSFMFRNNKRGISEHPDSNPPHGGLQKNSNILQSIYKTGRML